MYFKHKISVIKQNYFNGSTPALFISYYCILLHTAVILHQMYKTPAVHNGKKNKIYVLSDNKLLCVKTTSQLIAQFCDMSLIYIHSHISTILVMVSTHPFATFYWYRYL